MQSSRAAMINDPPSLVIAASWRCRHLRSWMKASAGSAREDCRKMDKRNLMQILSRGASPGKGAAAGRMQYSVRADACSPQSPYLKSAGTPFTKAFLETQNMARFDTMLSYACAPRAGLKPLARVFKRALGNSFPSRSA